MGESKCVRCKAMLVKCRLRAAVNSQAGCRRRLRAHTGQGCRTRRQGEGQTRTKIRDPHRWRPRRAAFKNGVHVHRPSTAASCCHAAHLISSFPLLDVGCYKKMPISGETANNGVSHEKYFSRFGRKKMLWGFNSGFIQLKIKICVVFLYYRE